MPIFNLFGNDKEFPKLSQKGILYVFANQLLGNPVHLHIGDRYYSLPSDEKVKQILKNFEPPSYIKEKQDCGDIALALWYLFAGSGYAVGLLKYNKHMWILYINEHQRIKIIEPTIKSIYDQPKSIDYLVMV